jgi:phage regulator Rha-like protein
MKTKIISINNQRMSSLEIAKLCGKNHKDVMRAIRKWNPHG